MDVKGNDVVVPWWSPREAHEVKLVFEKEVLSASEVYDQIHEMIISNQEKIRTNGVGVVGDLLFGGGSDMNSYIFSIGFYFKKWMEQAEKKYGCQGEIRIDKEQISTDAYKEYHANRIEKFADRLKKVALDIRKADLESNNES